MAVLFCSSAAVTGSRPAATIISNGGRQVNRRQRCLRAAPVVDASGSRRADVLIGADGSFLAVGQGSTPIARSTRRDASSVRVWSHCTTHLRQPAKKRPRPSNRGPWCRAGRIHRSSGHAEHRSADGQCVGVRDVIALARRQLRSVSVGRSPSAGDVSRCRDGRTRRARCPHVHRRRPGSAGTRG